MAILFLFILGIANFAMHKAVLQSGHPLVAHVSGLFGALGGRFGLALEFVILLGAMLAVDAGAAGWAWGYFFYTTVNGVTAWLILSGRI